MTGKALWDQYQHYTRDFTVHARTLGFGGVGVCWLFREEDFRFPVLIYAALFLFVSYFICDILHSLVGALTVRIFTEREEARMWKATGSISGEILKPRWVDMPATIFFLLKASLLIAGFGVVATELLRRLL